MEAGKGTFRRDTRPLFLGGIDDIAYRRTSGRLEEGTLLLQHKGLGEKFCPENKKILVIDQRGSVTAVLPDRDLPVGVVGANEKVVIYREGGAYGAAVRPRLSAAAPML